MASSVVVKRVGKEKKGTGRKITAILNMHIYKSFATSRVLFIRIRIDVLLIPLFLPLPALELWSRYFNISKAIAFTIEFVVSGDFVLALR